MIVTYHELVEGAAASPYVYAVTAGRMREHMRALRRRAAAGLGDTPVTFDDGLRCHYTIGARVLDGEGARGIFFITPKWTGAPGYMDWPAIRDLHASGHEIQSHGWSHALLPRCAADDLRIELVRSKEVLEDRIGSPVDAIAIPGGAYTGAVLAACAEAGYQRVYISNPWLRPSWTRNVLVIGRLMIRNSTTTERLEALLATEKRALSLPRVAYQARRVARATLGLTLYHGLWSLLASASRRPVDGNRQ
jgi:peptidoglycan/xylan/chitin deacetylase (PgdA/CDA1 family)